MSIIVVEAVCRVVFFSVTTVVKHWFVHWSLVHCFVVVVVVVIVVVVAAIVVVLVLVVGC